MRIIMDKITDISVDINDLIEALDMDNYFENAYLNTLTGKIVNVMDDDDFLDDEDEEFDDDDEEESDDDEFIPDHFLSLPDKFEVNKFGMMEDFCNLVENKKVQQHLYNALGGKGSFGRFMATLRAHEMENEWYRYLHECLKEFSIQFCVNNDLKYHYSKPKYLR